MPPPTARPSQTNSASDPPARAPTLRSERLVLRAWRDSDRAPFAALNADPRVMEHFQHTYTRAESDATVENILAEWRRGPFVHWAVEIPAEAPFIGMISLSRVGFDVSFAPAVEVGWRFAHAHWGRGYAPEGARAALEFGFESLGLDEVVSFTAATNANSRRVMEKLGMQRDADGDFDHPRVPEGHRVRRHVLYRLRAAQWRGARRSAG